MSQLSERDLALLSNIIYCDYLVQQPNGMSLQLLVEEMLKPDFPWEHMKLCGDFGHLEKTVGREVAIDKYKQILLEVQSSQGLQHVKITDPMLRDGIGITAACFVDSRDNTATAVFRGTDGSYKQWMDNFEGAGNEYTPMQLVAMEYINRLSDIYKDITVTGHSKGGNVSAFVTIMCERVSRCISFDGQGFSESFKLRFDAQIESNRDNIKTISSYNDFVNILLFSISGETVYVNNNMGNTGEFMEAHYASNLVFDNEFDENGNFISLREQDPLVQNLKTVLDSVLSFIPEEYVEWFSDTFLCLAAVCLGSADFDDIIDIATRIINGAAEHPKLFAAIVAVAVTLATVAAVAYIAYKTVEFIVNAIMSVVDAIVNVAKTIGQWAIDFANAVKNAISAIAKSIRDWWDRKGINYAAENPYFKVDTGNLRGYATRINNVNNRLRALDSALSIVFWQVSTFDMWRFAWVKLLTSGSPTLMQIKSYLQNAADDIDAAENKAHGYMGG